MILCTHVLKMIANEANWLTTNPGENWTYANLVVIFHEPSLKLTLLPTSDLLLLAGREEAI